MPAAKRRKSCNSTAAKGPTRGQPVQEQAAQYLLGTARFPVDTLTPVWSKGTNRLLDIRQVRELCDSFRHERLLRESEGNRLQVCYSCAEFVRIIVHLAITTSDRASGAGNSLLSFHDWVEVNRSRAELMARQYWLAVLERFLQKEFLIALPKEHS